MASPVVSCGQSTQYSFAQAAELNCTHVSGDLVVTNARVPTLEALAHLVRVEGSLYIFANPFITNLAGLGALVYVGGSFTIAGNDAIQSFDGLSALATVGSVSVQSNSRLLNWLGLCGVASNGSIEVRIGTNIINNLGQCNNVFTDRASLKSAVDSWVADSASASIIFGNIASWDVGMVADMQVRSMQPLLAGGIRMCGVDMCVAWCVGAREGAHRDSLSRGPHSS